MAFIAKGNASNGRNPPSCPFSALPTPFPVTSLINQEVTDCINDEAIGDINKAAMGAIIAGRNLASCFLLFHVLLF